MSLARRTLRRRNPWPAAIHTCSARPCDLRARARTRAPGIFGLSAGLERLAADAPPLKPLVSAFGGDGAAAGYVASGRRRRVPNSAGRCGQCAQVQRALRHGVPASQEQRDAAKQPRPRAPAAPRAGTAPWRSRPRRPRPRACPRPRPLRPPRRPRARGRRSSRPA
jgi:hypothetical protein